MLLDRPWNGKSGKQEVAMIAQKIMDAKQPKK
jgi:hypothetical protein